jgi:hypothetical protein
MNTSETLISAYWPLGSRGTTLLMISSGKISLITNIAPAHLTSSLAMIEEVLPFGKG